jgi:GDP-L-fucose synthase
LHAAKIKGDPTYSCWGTGSALREFLYSDDLADAAISLAEMSEVSGLVNVGYGSDISIRDLVYKVAKVVGYKGEIVWDPSKPDGTPRKILDSSRLRNITSWTPKVDLDKGLPIAYSDFLTNSVRI